MNGKSIDRTVRRERERERERAKKRQRSDRKNR